MTQEGSGALDTTVRVQAAHHKNSGASDDEGRPS